MCYCANGFLSHSTKVVVVMVTNLEVTPVGLVMTLGGLELASRRAAEGGSPQAVSLRMTHGIRESPLN